MIGGHNENPGARAAQPGFGNRHAKAAGNPSVSQSRGRAKQASLYEIHPEGGEPFTIEATLWPTGRTRWAGKCRFCLPPMAATGTTFWP